MPKEAGKQGGLALNWEIGLSLGTSGSLLVGPLTPQEHPSPIFFTLGRRIVGTRD